MCVVFELLPGDCADFAEAHMHLMNYKSVEMTKTTNPDAERDKFHKFLEQIQLLRADIKEAEDRAHVELPISRVAIVRLYKRTESVLEEFYG